MQYSNRKEWAAIVSNQNHISHQKKRSSETRSSSLPQIISLCASSLNNPPLLPIAQPASTAQTKMQNFCNNIFKFFLSCIVFIIVCCIFYYQNNNWTTAFSSCSLRFSANPFVSLRFFISLSDFFLLPCWKLRTRPDKEIRSIDS